MPRGEFVLVGDDSCHWYLIPRSLKSDFHKWVKAMDSDDPWHGHDYDDDRIDGPHRIVINEYHEI